MPATQFVLLGLCISILFNLCDRSGLGRISQTRIRILPALCRAWPPLLLLAAIRPAALFAAHAAVGEGRLVGILSVIVYGFGTATANSRMRKMSRSQSLGGMQKIKWLEPYLAIIDEYTWNGILVELRRQERLEINEIVSKERFRGPLVILYEENCKIVIHEHYANCGDIGGSFSDTKYVRAALAYSSPYFKVEFLLAVMSLPKMRNELQRLAAGDREPKIKFDESGRNGWKDSPKKWKEERHDHNDMMEVLLGRGADGQGERAKTVKELGNSKRRSWRELGAILSNHKEL